MFCILLLFGVRFSHLCGLSGIDSHGMWFDCPCLLHDVMGVETMIYTTLRLRRVNSVVLEGLKNPEDQHCLISQGLNQEKLNAQDKSLCGGNLCNLSQLIILRYYFFLSKWDSFSSVAIKL